MPDSPYTEEEEKNYLWYFQGNEIDEVLEAEYIWCYWDGPVNGVLNYKEKRYWFQYDFDDTRDYHQPRLYKIFRMISEEKIRENLEEGLAEPIGFIRERNLLWSYDLVK